MTTDAYAAVLATPISGGWRVGIKCRDGVVCEVDFLAGEVPLVAPTDACSRAAAERLQRYFAAGTAALDLPLALQGTPFQQRVWQAMRAIPAGERRSYGELARQLHTSPRAVAAACRANPTPLLVPCHRVVASHGLGGFMGRMDGAPLRLKQWLLDHESVGG